MKDELEKFRQYNAAVGADYYAVSAIEYLSDDKKRGFMVNKKDGYDGGFPPAALEKSMRRLVSLKDAGRNIYYTPISEHRHHLLIDDLCQESLAELLIQGYRPAVIIESSPANYQAILNIPKQGSDFDREIANRLVSTLNIEFGDPKVSGEIHAHRAPGFENKKLKYRKADGSFPKVKLIEAPGGMCHKTIELANKIRENLERQRTESRLFDITTITNADIQTTASAFKIHLKDVIRLQKMSGNKNIDASRVDAMVCLRLRATGHNAQAIEEVLRTSALDTREAIGRSGQHNWVDYAKRTIYYIFGPAGDREIKKLEKYISLWSSLENQEQEQRKRRDK